MTGIFDGGYASSTYGHEDPAQGRHKGELIKAVITQARVMRRMPCLLKRVNLELPNLMSLAEIGQADFWAPAVRSFERLLTAQRLRSSQNK